LPPASLIARLGMNVTNDSLIIAAGSEYYGLAAFFMESVAGFIEKKILQKYYLRLYYNSS
jgi:hypothetical protein